MWALAADISAVVTSQPPPPPPFPIFPKPEQSLCPHQECRVVSAQSKHIYLLILFPRCQMESMLVIEVFLVHLVNAVVFVGWGESLGGGEHDRTVITAEFITCTSH